MCRVFWVIILLLIFSCKNRQEVLQENFEKTLRLMHNNNISQYKAYLVIPNAGCEGCISSAERFVIDNIKQENDLMVIFTKINSMKILKLKIKEVINSPNIIFDKDNLMYSNHVESIYPMIFYVKNSQISNMEYISPDNVNGLTNLKISLASQDSF
ncbi:hypothetical protein SAMN04488541_101581 [Thermoflexibacter ruber]|uniref:Uncharacterized protein n=1 Tax=Thermoflexibacter ruber TaxID=1003 RepID=A0A1I2FWC4_9BACT|nr:hypothetical protein SAMN04488541_101581 [Thermoflexibacter ruber]